MDASALDCHAVTDGAVDDLRGAEEAPPGAVPAETDEKSEGQALLERLLAVRQHLRLLDAQLQRTKLSIGIGEPRDNAGEGVTTTTALQFLPALRLLAEEMEQTAGDLERHINDIANAF